MRQKFHKHWPIICGRVRSLKPPLKVVGLFYLCSFIVGSIVAILFLASSQAFIEFVLRGTIAGAWITPFLEPKNPLMIGLSIFLINFILGAFARFVLIPIFLYHLAFILGGLVGFFMGFVAGSPSFLSYLSDFPSFESVLLISTIIFENLGYIVACAVGFKIAKESQESLTRKGFLKLLVVPIHLKDAERRKTIRKGLSAIIPWILLSIIFIFLGAIFETLLIVFFK